MTDLIAKLLAHIRGMWRFRWAALVVAWLIALAGWYSVYKMPDHYQATAQVYVDTDSVLRPLLRGISTENDVMSKVELMTRALMSRPNLLEVAQKTDLDLRAGTEQELEDLLTSMRSKLTILASGNNVYSISFRDTEPQMTRDVVQVLLGTFVGDTLKEGREKSTEAVVFIEKQIAEYEERLTEAEERLADFKKRHVGLMPGETGTYYQRLETALQAQAQLESQIAIAARTRRELMSQLEGEEPTFGLFNTPTAPSGPTGSSYDGRIQQLEDSLSQLRMTFTDKHPDVLGVIEQIDELKARRDEEMAEQRATVREPTTNSYNPMDLNPVFQQMRIALSNVEVELGTLNTRLAQQREIVANLRRSVDTVPEVEAQLARLNRDYDVTKSRYEDLLQRLETARMGETAQGSVNDMRFRVIEPPRLPLEPFGPNRFLFLSMTLLAALGAGVAFAFFMDQIRPVYITRDDLAKKTGLPVLGAIGVVLMPRQRFVMRMQKAAFLAGILGLIMVYGLAVTFEEPFVEFLRSVQLGASG